MKIIGFIDDSAKQNGTFHDLHAFARTKKKIRRTYFRHVNNIVKNAKDRGLDKCTIFTISKLGKGME